MGYRSDIGLALSQIAVQALHQKLNALDKNSEAFTAINGFLVYATRHFEDADTGAKVYLWEYVKWYEEFSEVNFIETFLAELAPEHFLFLRIGESWDDTETKRLLWDNPFDLGITRRLTMAE